jgi:hypothetical protein
VVAGPRSEPATAEDSRSQTSCCFGAQSLTPCHLPELPSVVPGPGDLPDEFTMQGNDNPDSSAGRSPSRDPAVSLPVQTPVGPYPCPPTGVSMYILSLYPYLYPYLGIHLPTPWRSPRPVRRAVPWPSPRLKVNELEVPLEARQAGRLSDRSCQSAGDANASDCSVPEHSGPFSSAHTDAVAHRPADTRIVGKTPARFFAHFSGLVFSVEPSYPVGNRDVTPHERRKAAPYA